jgi:hypothetical protein
VQDNSDQGHGARKLAPQLECAYRWQMQDAPADHDSPDHDERLEDFFARHGGPGSRGVRKGESDGGIKGWSEAHAGDGYVLRCDWSTFGSRDEMNYTEIAPQN